MKINSDLQALYVERGRLKVSLDKVEEDIRAMETSIIFPKIFIIDGREVKVKIEQLGDDE